MRLLNGHGVAHPRGHRRLSVEGVGGVVEAPGQVGWKPRQCVPPVKPRPLKRLRHREDPIRAEVEEDIQAMLVGFICGHGRVIEADRERSIERYIKHDILRPNKTTGESEDVSTHTH